MALQHALARAVNQGSIEDAQSLIARKADVSALFECESYLRMATKRGDLPMVRLLLQHHAPLRAPDRKYNAAAIACKRGYREILELLLEQPRSSIDCRGTTPLVLAFEYQRYELVDLLLRHGCSIHAKSDSGLSPLHVAAARSLTAVRMCLDLGAQVDDPDMMGSEPLQFAAFAGRADCVRELLEACASVNNASSSGRTALHQAAKKGSAECVALLLHYGADKSALHGENTAADVACSDEIRRIIEIHGTDALLRRHSRSHLELELMRLSQVGAGVPVGWQEHRRSFASRLRC